MAIANVLRRHRLLSRAISLATLMVCNLSAVAAGRGPHTTLQEKSATIEKLYNSLHDPFRTGGFAAAVIKDGNVIFKKAYGFADQEHHIPFTTSTMFDFASLAKQFTGFAIAKLVQGGKIGIDDDIRKYLPEVPAFAHRITVRHLLGHTSGLRDFVSLARISGRQDDDVISDEFLMRLVRSQEALNFEPGEMYMYSNTGYFLLAKIVARVTGQSFREWTRDNIFRPLGMTATLFRDDYQEVLKNSAKSYVRGPDGIYRSSVDSLEACGSSSLMSTLDDMIRWVVNLDSHEIGGDELFRMMLEPVVLNDGTHSDYNFGLEKKTFSGREYISHGGSWRGFVCSISHFPAERVSVIFLANRSPSGVYARNRVFRIMLEVENEVSEETGETINQDRAVADIDEHVIDDYIGTYAYRIDHPTGIYDQAKVFRRDGNFVFHSFLYRNNRLYPSSANEFFIIGDSNTFTFQRDGDGRCQGVVIKHKGERYPYHRVERFIKDYKGAADYYGEYDCRELSTAYRVFNMDGVLTAESLQNGPVALSRVGSDCFLSDQDWFEEVVFTRDKDKKVDGFLLQTSRGNGVRNLRFTKNQSTSDGASSERVDGIDE